MAQITHERIYSLPKSNTLSSSRVFVIHTLPAFIFFASVLLLFSFSVMLLATFGGLSIGSKALRPNPFSAYEAVWPGQSIASVATYALRTPDGSVPCVSGASPLHPFMGLEVRVAPIGYDALRKITNCMSSPNDGLFRWVTMAIADNRVQELQLFSDFLQQDTLLLYWGAPDAISKSGNGSQLNLYWERRTYSAMASVLEQDSVVKSVTLTAKK